MGIIKMGNMCDCATATEAIGNAEGFEKFECKGFCINKKKAFGDAHENYTLVSKADAEKEPVSKALEAVFKVKGDATLYLSDAVATWDKEGDGSVKFGDKADPKEDDFGVYK